MKKRWCDSLPADVYERLGMCRSKRSDISILVNAKWLFMKEQGKDKEVFTKEDALVEILDLLDCNGQFFDLTKDEYAELWKE